MFTTCRSEPWPADTGTSPTLVPSESSSWQAQIWTLFLRFLASWKINGRNHCELKFERHRHGRGFHGFELFTWHVRDVRALGLLYQQHSRAGCGSAAGPRASTLLPIAHELAVVVVLGLYSMERTSRPVQTLPDRL